MLRWQVIVRTEAPTLDRGTISANSSASNSGRAEACFGESDVQTVWLGGWLNSSPGIERSGRPEILDQTIRFAGRVDTS